MRRRVGGFAGLFNGQAKLGRQYDSGLMVDSLGLSYAMDQNVAVHTNGAATATNINGAGQTGSTITVVAVAGGTLAAGTVITLPGVLRSIRSRASALAFWQTSW
jgi:hypothetical protein